MKSYVDCLALGFDIYKHMNKMLMNIKNFARNAATAIALIALPISVVADFKYSDYLELSQSARHKDKLENYVVGVGRGIFWANIQLSIQNKKPLFCPPKDFNTEAHVITNLLRLELQQPTNGKNYEPHMPIELILTRSFANRFPC